MATVSLLVHSVCLTLITAQHIVRHPCPADCPIRVQRGENQSYVSEQCHLQRDTFKCVHSYKEKSELESCPETLLQMDIRPTDLKHIELRALPRVHLNMSMSVLSPISSLILRLDCLSGNPNEALCHNRTRPEHWGGFMWPCKRFNLEHFTGDVRFPMKFNFACFHMESHSEFRINVTLLPQNCRSVYFVSIPETHQVLFHRFPKTQQWAPLIWVDTSPPDGVVVSVSAVPWDTQNISRIVLKLIDEQKQERKFSLFPPNVGYKFVGLERGTYVAKAIVKTKSCYHCLKSQIRFWIENDKFDLGNNATTNAFTDALIPVGSILAVLLSIVLLTGLVVKLLACRRQVPSVAQISLVTMERQPKVLLLYTNDHPAHLACVEQLAQFLKSRINCTVFLDMWALNQPGIAPTEWLNDALQQANYYAVVFSEGTKLAFQGVQLCSNRHWQELFGPGVTCVLQELFSDCSSRPRHSGELLSKYLWLRFSNSPAACVESFLSRLPCARFELTDDLQRLICHLQQMPYESLDSSQPLEAPLLTQAIEAATEFGVSAPDWLNDATRRRQSEDNQLNRIRDELARLGERVAYQPQLDVGQQYVHLNSGHQNEFGLVEPDSETQNGPEFPLVGGPDSDSSDEESSLLN